ncbi:MAG: hypothetical protein HC826_01150, partial [Rhodospirillales bacterium]|nr:hypothetical protein [Rhodospirillales bacterium]
MTSGNTTVTRDAGDLVAAPSRREQPLIFWALLTVVVLAPLPLGSVDEWSWSLLTTLVGVLLLLWAGLVITGRQVLVYGLRSIWPIALLFATALGWAFLQNTGGSASGM